MPTAAGNQSERARPKLFKTLEHAACGDPHKQPAPKVSTPGNEVSMKIRELAKHWEENAKGRLTRGQYNINLDLESAARLAALSEMYPKRNVEELLAELVAASLEELEASLPYVKGNQVVAVDEQGDPLYEDIGPTPRFLALSRRYLQDLSEQRDSSNH
jgi:hypothetical protein